MSGFPRENTEICNQKYSARSCRVVRRPKSFAMQARRTSCSPQSLTYMGGGISKTVVDINPPGGFQESGPAHALRSEGRFVASTCNRDKNILAFRGRTSARLTAQHFARRRVGRNCFSLPFARGAAGAQVESQNVARDFTVEEHEIGRAIFARG